MIKTLVKKINQCKSSVDEERSALQNQNFAVYKEDSLIIGNILDNLKRSMDRCYDLGIELIREYGWKEPEKLGGLEK